MIELACAALTGGSLAALRHTKRGKMKMLRVFLTGFFLAWYVGEDVVNLTQQLMKFEVSKGGTLFMVSFLGAEFLERLILFIRTLNVNMLWNKNDDT